MSHMKTETTYNHYMKILLWLLVAFAYCNNILAQSWFTTHEYAQPLMSNQSAKNTFSCQTKPLVALTGYGCPITITNLETGSKIYLSLVGDTGSTLLTYTLQGLGFANDGKEFWAREEYTDDANIHVFDIESGQEIYNFTAYKSFLSQDGNTFIYHMKAPALNMFYFMSTATKKVLDSATISIDGSHPFEVGGRIVYRDDAPNWYVSFSNMLYTLDKSTNVVIAKEQLREHGKSSQVNLSTISPNGAFMVTLGHLGPSGLFEWTYSIVDWKSHQLIDSIRLVGLGVVPDVAISSDSRYCAFPEKENGTFRVLIYDMQRRQIVDTLNFSEEAWTADKVEDMEISWLSDSESLVILRDELCEIYNTRLRNYTNVLSLPEIRESRVVRKGTRMLARASGTAGSCFLYVDLLNDNVKLLKCALTKKYDMRYDYYEPSAMFVQRAEGPESSLNFTLVYPEADSTLYVDVDKELPGAGNMMLLRVSTKGNYVIMATDSAKKFVLVDLRTRQVRSFDREPLYSSSGEHLYGALVDEDASRIILLYSFGIAVTTLDGLPVLGHSNTPIRLNIGYASGYLPYSASGPYLWGMIKAPNESVLLGANKDTRLTSLYYKERLSTYDYIKQSFSVVDSIAVDTSRFCFSTMCGTTRMATAYMNGSVRIWDWKARKPLLELDPLPMNHLVNRAETISLSTDNEPFAAYRGFRRRYVVARMTGPIANAEEQETSVDTHEHAGLEVFPQPVNEQAVITGSPGVQIQNIRIYSLIGEDLTPVLDGFGGEYRVDTRSLGVGMYVVRATTIQGQNYSRTFVVQR